MTKTKYRKAQEFAKLLSIKRNEERALKCSNQNTYLKTNTLEGALHINKTPWKEFTNNNKFKKFSKHSINDN